MQFIVKSVIVCNRCT